ncbi:hypothetical protein GCM10023162_20720 [Klenkia terrae]
MSVLAATSSDQGGITGFLLDLIETLGPVGVGLTIFIETVVPPIPSEVVLSAAGVLINDGRMALVPTILFATLGSVLGAAVLYQVGRSLGPRRSHAFLDRLPLVKTADVDRTFEWFERHDRPAVFFGRMVPIVRSFVSVPAGVVKMPWAQFLAYTTLGSLIVVNDYLQYFDYVIYVAVVAVVVWFVVRGVRERLHQGDAEPDRSAADRLLETERRRDDEDR